MIGVRAAVADDRAAIAACLGDDVFTRVEVAVALELVDGALAGDPDYRLQVAEVDGAIAGYACFGPSPMTAASWDLYWIAVAAPARGRGVGIAQRDLGRS